MSIIWRELFPTKTTLMIFILYMSLFIGQGIFVTASQEQNNSYSYNTVTVVLLTEILKLFISITLYCKEHHLTSLLADMRKDSNVMLLYCVPAFLYCLYNNLSFVNLATFDPTTYYLLLQLRVVITGLLFQIIFKNYLSRRQWLSLVLLTIGCMLKELNFNSFLTNVNDDSGILAAQPQSLLSTNNSVNSRMANKNISGFSLNFSALLILGQIIFSCLAGVYNEYLLKDKGVEVNIFVQNVFMYVDSIACNVFILLLQGQLLAAFTLNNLEAIFRFKVLIIVVNNAAIGLVTSFFLKYMNSILKSFASALELLFTAILCYFLFNIPIYINTALAIAVVSFAIYLYSQSPVVNTGKLRSTQKRSELITTLAYDNRKLLESEGDSDLEMDIV
ncbi:UDP-galactose transporter senju [Glossina fuscipes]|uniref:UDP-galactose transporter senju n=1 Tax=Glossina fuscipes TaxID=7396 RepID=A0A8U0WM00_9MUSC|nr:UDP-galactose transporter senju [Glossina fuscipes]